MWLGEDLKVYDEMSRAVAETSWSVKVKVEASTARWFELFSQTFGYSYSEMRWNWVFSSAGIPELWN